MTPFGRWIQTGVVSLACLVSLGAYASAGTAFTDAFSGGGLFSRYDVRGRCPECFSIGGGALRVTNKNGKEGRAELSPRRSSAQARYNVDMEWQFDVKFTKKSSDYMIFWQVNTKPYKGPDLMLATQKGKIKAFVRKGGAKSKSMQRKVIGSMPTGKWMDFKVRFRRHLKRGYFQVVVNGKTVWTYDDGPTTQSTSTKSRSKFGLYSGKSKRGAFEAQFDNIRVIRR